MGHISALCPLCGLLAQDPVHGAGACRDSGEGDDSVHAAFCRNCLLAYIGAFQQTPLCCVPCPLHPSVTLVALVPAVRAVRRIASHTPLKREEAATPSDGQIHVAVTLTEVAATQPANFEADLPRLASPRIDTTGSASFTSAAPHRNLRCNGCDTLIAPIDESESTQVFVCEECCTAFCDTCHLSAPFIHPQGHVFSRRTFPGIEKSESTPVVAAPVATARVLRIVPAATPPPSAEKNEDPTPVAKDVSVKRPNAKPQRRAAPKLVTVPIDPSKFFRSIGTFSAVSNRTEVTGTTTAVTKSCGHACQLSDRMKTCCTCSDKRPIRAGYERYIDGHGFSQSARRSDYYCNTCRRTGR
ncbi:hypothetical protein HDU84_006950 [Entophlyctis sp. JEL0112]|nr:hypothetical protein HDU84_006950 [Entophlyctis sp. JEL0112]